MHSIFIKFLFSPWEFRSQKCHINICFSFMLLPFARINVRAAGKTPRCDDIQMENNAIGRCVRMLALQLSYSAYIFTFIISIKFVFCWQMGKKPTRIWLNLLIVVADNFSPSPLIHIIFDATQYVLRLLLLLLLEEAEEASRILYSVGIAPHAHSKSLMWAGVKK